MLKCPNHELPGNIIIDNFYARLSFQDKTLLDTTCSGSFTSNKEEFKRDLLDRIKENAEDWENDKGKESGINYDYECIETFMDSGKFRNMSATYGLDSQVAANLYKAFASHLELPRKNFDKYHEPFKEACMKNDIVVNNCNKHAQTPKNAISYKHVNFCGIHRPCGINQIEDEYCIHHRNEKTRKWSRALDDLGEKVCALYPFICELCHRVGHFNFQCSSNDNSNPMSAANLYCDDEIIPNQHDELTLFLKCEELSRKISLLNINDLDIDDVLHGCLSYCIDNSHTNTYIQNILEDDTLPKYDRTAVCFQLINEKEGSSQVSSIVSKSKSGYADKPPFKPLPPKEGNEEKEEKKKKKKGTKKKKKKENKKKEVTAYPRVNEITLGNRKYVAPNDYCDNESEYDDLPMPFTYISDHDLNEHTTFDIENLFGTDYESNDDSIIHVPLYDDIESSKLGDVVLEDPIFETSTFSENDDITYSGLDNYCRDVYDTCYNYPYETCHSYVGIAKNHSLSMQLVYHVQILDNDTFMHMNHDKNVLSDGYIVDFINDATESYYERGKHGYMHLNNIKFPLFMLRILKLLVFYLPMLVTLFFMNLFVYKIHFHRKRVRLKCVLNLLLDALFCFNPYFLREHH